jgi:3-methyl-2-oxobutanoate hydroxymethyltransferase
VKRALLIVDMPFGSYHVSCGESLANAVRFVKEAGAEAVKIEGGEKRVDLIAKILDAEIPVCGHIGLTPQSVHKMGGYKVQGKSLPAIEQLKRDAAALDRAGVCLLVLEGIPREVAAMITAEIETPTIGIGAGPECDGQILVFHDLVNLTFAAPAKFVRRYADAGALIGDAVRGYCADVKSGAFPSDSESYHLPKDSQTSMAMAAGRRTVSQR